MRLIDADALMGEVNIEIKEYMLTEKGMRSLIRNAPTIDAVSVVHGEWIESNLIKDGRIFICSNCNMAWVSKKRTMDGMNYCPNCGARMDGESDDE